MKGTAILFQQNVPITVVEGIEESQFKEIINNNANHYQNIKVSKKVQENLTTPIIWKEEDVDWDYGY